MKLRSFFSVLAAVVVALVSIGAIGAYWIASSRPVPVVQPMPTQPSGAMFVSRQAPLMASLLVNPDRLEAGVGGLTIGPSLPEQLRQLQQSLFTQWGVDYDRDVKPWLGDEVTTAITATDLDRDEENGLQPGYLTVLAVRDAAGAKASLQRFWRRSNLDQVTDNFAGVEITAAPTKPGSSDRLASAMVGDRYVLLANSPKVIRDALNGVQVSELNLEQNQRYQQALEQFAGEKVGFVFANLPDTVAVKWAQSWAGSDSELAEDGIEDSLAIALKPFARGLVVEAELVLSQGGSAVQLASSSELMPDLAELRAFVPNGSRWAIVAADLAQTWQRWQQSNLAAMATMSGSSGNPLAQWGLDQQMLFEWAQGAFVLAEPGGDRANWLLVTDRSAATEAGIEQLNQRAQQQELSLGSFALGDQTIYAWTKLVTSQAGGKPNLTSLQTQVQGVHTAIGQYQVFATSLEALGMALAAQTAEPETSDLQAAAVQIGSTDGYLYLSRDGLKTVLQGFPLQAAVQQAGRVRSAVVGRNPSDAESLRGKAVLFLEN